VFGGAIAKEIGLIGEHPFVGDPKFFIDAANAGPDRCGGFAGAAEVCGSGVNEGGFLVSGGKLSGWGIKADGAADGSMQSPAACGAGDRDVLCHLVFAEAPAAIPLIAAVCANLDAYGSNGTANQAVAEFARDGCLGDAWLKLAAGDFDSMYEYAAELLESLQFEVCECQPQHLQGAGGGATAGQRAVAENSAAAAKVLQKGSVRLEPFALFQLKAESEGVAFEELRGVDGVGGKNPCILGQKNTRLASVGRVATKVCAGGDPGEIGRVLEEHSVGGGGAKQLADASVLVLDIGKPLSVLDEQTGLVGWVAWASCHAKPFCRA
jgi:hypothetical protein